MTIWPTKRCKKTNKTFATLWKMLKLKSKMMAREDLLQLV